MVSTHFSPMLGLVHFLATFMATKRRKSLVRRWPKADDVGLEVENSSVSMVWGQQKNMVYGVYHGISIIWLDIYV